MTRAYRLARAVVASRKRRMAKDRWLVQKVRAHFGRSSLEIDRAPTMQRIANEITARRLHQVYAQFHDRPTTPLCS